jgi:CheY-like chemotaxis protein
MKARSRGKTVLIVEDEFLIAMTLEDSLREAGIATIGPASTHEEAIRLLESAQVDAAILDFNLGGQYSTPVAEHLKASGIPFVMTTGYGATVDVNSLGAETVFDKPYTPESVVDALLRILGEE